MKLCINVLPRDDGIYMKRQLTEGDSRLKQDQNKYANRKLFLCGSYEVMCRDVFKDEIVTSLWL